MKKALIGAVVVVAIISVFIFWPRKVVRTPLSPDLILNRQTVATNQNAFFILDDLHLTGTQQSEIGGYSESWDLEEIREILEKYSFAIEALDKCKTFPFLQVPEVDDFSPDTQYMGTWRTLGQLSSIKARSLFLQGREAEAFQVAGETGELGLRIQSSGGSLLHYMIGGVIKAVAEGAIKDFVLRSTNLAVLQNRLKHWTHDSRHLTALSNVFKAEYSSFVEKIDLTKTGNIPGLTVKYHEMLVWKATRPVLLNTFESEKVAATLTRTNLNNINKTWSEMTTNGPLATADNNTKLYLSGNSVGLILLEMMMPAHTSILKRKCAETVDARATQVIMALRCYQLKHGSLPGNLADLVPEFLPAVPLDDFDGKPMKYSKERKVVYSVGEDLIDSGGIEKDTNKNRLDIFYPLVME